MGYITSGYISLPVASDSLILRDLYYLVKFLPSYALPAGMPSTTDVTQFQREAEETVSIVLEKSSFGDENRQGNGITTFSGPPSPLLPKSVRQGRHSRSLPPSLNPPVGRTSISAGVLSPRSSKSINQRENERMVLTKPDESFLMPSHMPPKYSLFDLFPFSLLVSFLSKRGRDVKGKKGARVRAQLKQRTVSHNLPLELSFYLVRFFLILLANSVKSVSVLRVLTFQRFNNVKYATYLPLVWLVYVPTLVLKAYNLICFSRHPSRYRWPIGRQFDWP